MKALGFLTNAKKKMEKMLDDFNRALPALKSLGLSVTNLQVDMGFLPGIIATLKGSFEDMEPRKIRYLKEGNSENKVLGSILRALESAANIKNLMGELMVYGIQVRVKLGLIPKVEIGFITSKSDASKADIEPSDKEAA